MEASPESDQVPIIREEYWTLFILKENNSLDGFREPFYHIAYKWSLLLLNVFSSFSSLPPNLFPLFEYYVRPNFNKDLNTSGK